MSMLCHFSLPSLVGINLLNFLPRDEHSQTWRSGSSAVDSAQKRDHPTQNKQRKWRPTVCKRGDILYSINSLIFSDLGPTDEQVMNPSGPGGGFRSVKPTLCRYFSANGYCFYGDQCQFMHAKPTNESRPGT